LWSWSRSLSMVSDNPAEDDFLLCQGTYDVAGVTVTCWKLEQSAIREVTSGILPVRVPVTARAQLLALHAVVAADRTPETKSNPVKADVRYMMVRDVVMRLSICGKKYLDDKGEDCEKSAILIPFPGPSALPPEAYIPRASSNRVVLPAHSRQRTPKQRALVSSWLPPRWLNRLSCSYSPQLTHSNIARRRVTLPCFSFPIRQSAEGARAAVNSELRSSEALIYLSTMCMASSIDSSRTCPASRKFVLWSRSEKQAGGRSQALGSEEVLKRPPVSTNYPAKGHAYAPPEGEGACWSARCTCTSIPQNQLAVALPLRS
jgi:hypothetical protein